MTQTDVGWSAFAPPKVWCARSLNEVKNHPVDYKILSPDIYSAVSGPDIGVEFIQKLDAEAKHNINNNATSESSHGKVKWTFPSRKAYGVCMSLYDKNPVTGKVSGDPIADSYAFIARKNNALMVIADGVNWGEKSKIASRSAVDAVVNYITQTVFIQKDQVIHSTNDALRIMRTAFDEGHQTILDHNGGLTTLNITTVLPLRDSPDFAVCTVNVGDSLTYIFSKRYGMNELSIGSHDINEERDIRDAGGAIGPVNGKKPHLTNLTFSVTTCEPGDIVFLTTDGISDNFDPVVTKIAVPGKKDSELTSVGAKAEMLPHERHLFSMKGMEMIIHEYELLTEVDISAQELCTALSEHVSTLTEQKRAIIQNPELYNRKFRLKEKRKMEERIKMELRGIPGKLDHATVIAYESGIYRGEDMSNYLECSSNSDSTRTSSVSSNMEPVSSTMFESNV